MRHLYYFPIRSSRTDPYLLHSIYCLNHYIPTKYSLYNLFTSVNLITRSECMSSPSLLKCLSAYTLIFTTKSPQIPCAEQFPFLVNLRMLPLSTPAGISMSSLSYCVFIPVPLQLLHGCETIFPVPLQFPHSCYKIMIPLLMLTTPLPLQE